MPMDPKEPYAYRIHAHIRRVADGAFLVKVTVQSSDPKAPKITDIEPCSPCTLEEARKAALKFVSDITMEICNAGGRVIDVSVTDDGNDPDGN